MPDRGRHPSTLSVALALGTVYVVWGSTYLAIAYVVETLPPLLAAAIRFVVAGTALVAFVAAQHAWRRSRGLADELPRPRLVEWRTAVIVGVLLIVSRRGSLQAALPFGTFLALGALVAAVVGGPILSWYLAFY